MYALSTRTTDKTRNDALCQTRALDQADHESSNWQRWCQQRHTDDFQTLGRSLDMMWFDIRRDLDRIRGCGER